ncbi:hypothetical protein [Haloferula sargassicola]|uniref:Uncharacterized protein n=1 Tax=Haloferula sargassicola TaxID=490096 RepID=A0ABP9US96_9BACT
MVSHQHSSELNLLQQYRHTASLLHGTSRATNSGWYTAPLQHDFQLHLRFDGDTLTCRAWSRTTDTWGPGPEIRQELLGHPDQLALFAKQLVSLARGAGASSAGVILHIADEFATTEINPDLDHPGALPELREAVVSDPKSVLHDASLTLDEHAWRLIPYPAAGSEAIATAVTLSRGFEPFLSQLREYGNSQNFPILTLATSAPLLALLTLVELKTTALEKPFLAVLPYTRFTLLACFNEHGDLQLLRTLQHRGQKRPSNLRHAAATTATALEMASPEVLILPLNGSADPQLETDLRTVFPDSVLHQVDWSETPFREPYPGVSPEMLAAVRGEADESLPLQASHTFSTLRADGWATQDFLPVPAQEAETYPTAGEMKLMRFSRFTRLGLVAVTLAGLGWIGLGIVEMIRKPEWTFQPEEATLVNGQIKTFGAERARMEHWDNLLDDRSKGWVAMEMLARFFPEKSGMLVRSFTLSVSPQNQPGAAKAGFTKQWTISGLAREEALEKNLADFSTNQGISAAFSEIARVTGNQAFRTDLPTRNIVVNIRTLENATWRDRPPEEMDDTDESTYPFQFELVITQRFEADDPMALLVKNAP